MLFTLLRLRRTTRRIRRCTAAARRATHGLALLFIAGVSGTLASAQQYGGPGIPAGINAATGITGVATTDVGTTISNIIGAALTFATILAIGVVVIAGFYLILGLGNDSSRDTARKTILYTGIGIIILQSASAIVSFFFALPTGTVSSTFHNIIENIIGVALNFAGLAALAVIVIAGFYLLLGLGSDTSKDTAKKIILYAAVGLIILATARAIVDFLIGLAEGNPGGGQQLRETVVNIMEFALTLVGLVAVVVITIAGIFLLAGGGSDASKDTAKKIIIYAIVGIIIVVLANVIVNFVIDAVT